MKIVDIPIISGFPIYHVGKEVAGRGSAMSLFLSFKKGEENGILD